MRAIGWLLAAWVACLATAPASAQPAAAPLRGMLGANKPDLLIQYTGTASSQDGSDAARAVTTAMARKAIADAHDVGFAYLRIMAAGFGPVAPPPAGNPLQNDLALWQADPARYWARVDAMVADLDAAGIRLVPSFVWNPLQFPALTGETVADLIDNPLSASRALLTRYITAFVTRYRARDTILFYELTNELNLQVDLDIRGRCLARARAAANCAAYANFTTAQMNRFAQAMAHLIRSLDPAHPVGSGFALPRAGAYHLAAQPEFSPLGPDWTPDAPDQFRANLAGINAPFDLWSVHIYPGDVRWGNPAGTEAITLQFAASTALHHGRRLYLGEFGDSVVSPYLHAMLRQLAGGSVAYASVWVWEFYQLSTWQSADLTASPPTSLEPGFSDAIDAVLAQAAGGAGRRAVASVRIVLTAPLPCATVSGAIGLFATASASGWLPVDRVLFALDGVPVGLATTVPFHASTAALWPGRHVVTATAYAGRAAATARATVLAGAPAACRVPPAAAMPPGR